MPINDLGVYKYDFRMLLWDCDDRTYSYFIEVSVNMWDWELIVDKSHEMCSSWQTLFFDRRPIVFIRITGTRNSANEVSCVPNKLPLMAIVIICRG